MLKIGLVIYGHLQQKSGGYIYDQKIVELLKQKHTVEIISLESSNYSGYLKFNFNKNKIQQQIDTIKSLNLDLIIQDELCHPSLIRLNQELKKQLPQIKIISLVHHLRSLEPFPIYQKQFYQLIERLYLKTVDAFIAVSKVTAEDVTKLGIRKNHIIAHPSGKRWETPITLKELNRKLTETKKSKPIKICFLGNQIHRKGLHLVIKALAKLKNVTWEFAIIGNHPEPDYANNIQALIEKHQIKDRVKMIPWLDHQKLESTLKDYHLLTVPSYYEGFGMVYLEGMGLGLPAIGMNRGGAREVITHGVDGFLLEPGSEQKVINQFTRLLTKLFHDHELLNKLSINARKHYLEQNTWEDTVSKIERFLIQNCNPK